MEAQEETPRPEPVEEHAPATVQPVEEEPRTHRPDTGDAAGLEADDPDPVEVTDPADPSYVAAANGAAPIDDEVGAAG